jgi:hypothetical protein
MRVRDSARGRNAGPPATPAAGAARNAIPGTMEQNAPIVSVGPQSGRDRNAPP